MASDSFMASFDIGGLVETRPPSRSHQRQSSHTPPQSQLQLQQQQQPARAAELPEYDQETRRFADSENQVEETIRTQEYLDSNNEDLFADYQPSWEQSKDANEALFKEAQWMADKKVEIAAARKEMLILQQMQASLMDSTSQISDLATNKMREPEADRDGETARLPSDNSESIVKEKRPQSFMADLKSI